MADKAYEWCDLDDSCAIGILEYLPLLPSGGRLHLLGSSRSVLGPGSCMICDASGILSSVHGHCHDIHKGVSLLSLGHS